MSVLKLDEREQFVTQLCKAIDGAVPGRLLLDGDSFQQLFVTLECCDMCGRECFVLFAPHYGMPENIGHVWRVLHNRGIEYRYFDVAAAFAMLGLCFNEKDWALIKAEHKKAMRNQLVAVVRDVICDVHACQPLGDVFGAVEDDVMAQLIEHLNIKM